MKLRDKDGNLKFRWVAKGTVILLGIFLILMSDSTGPLAVKFESFGMSIAYATELFAIFIKVMILNYALIGMFDYIKYKKLLDEAEKSPIGSGLIYVAMGLFAIAISNVF